MGECIKYWTLCNVVWFAIHLAYRWALPHRFPRTPFLLVDGYLAITMGLCQAYWWRTGAFLAPNTAQVMARAVLSLWRTVRLALATSFGGHQPRPQPCARSSVLGAERFTLVWVCRSADFMLGCLPELDRILTDVNALLYGTKVVSHKLICLSCFCTEGSAHSTGCTGVRTCKP